MLRILALAAFLLAPAALAQQPDAALHRLAPFAGTYSLDGVAQVDDGTFDGTLTIQPVLGGYFQQWDWDMTMRGDGVREHVYLRFLIAYDQADGQYVIHRFDSRTADSPTRASSTTDPNRGELRFDGDALVMTWMMANPNDPADLGRFRNTVRLAPDGLRVVTDVQPVDGRPLLAIATTNAKRR